MKQYIFYTYEKDDIFIAMNLDSNLYLLDNGVNMVTDFGTIYDLASFIESEGGAFLGELE